MYDLGLWLAAGPSGLLAAWGLFNLLFAHEGRVNKVRSALGRMSFLVDFGAR